MKIAYPSCLAVLFASITAAPLAHAAPAALDLSFGGTGKVLISPLNNSGGYEQLAIQRDGKILITELGLTGGLYRLTRLNADGSLDMSFGGTGSITTITGGGSIALQKDGRIVVAGWRTEGSEADFAVARYLPNGNPDGSFGGSGIVTTDLGGSGGDLAWCVAIQGNGKIVVAGSSYRQTATEGTIIDFALVRYHEDGNLDTSFNGTGKVVTPAAGNNGARSFIALQSDGKIVVGAGVLVRYQANGALDTGFGSDGILASGLDTYSVALQADGKIVAVGSRYFSGVSHFTVDRYLSDGSMDMTFNGTGRVSDSSGGAARNVAVQTNGKIVAGGMYNFTTSSYDFYLVRYNSDGALDTTFNSTGKLNTDIGGFDILDDVVIQRNGSLLVAGHFRTWHGDNFTTALVRYHGDPLPIIAVEQPAGTDVPNGNGNLVEFGPVVSGSSGSKTFTIRNTGTGDLTGLAVAKTADGAPADFTIGPLGATIVPPNASTTFTVTFSPAAAGTRTATLQVASNDAEESTFEIHLAGTQATPLEAWRQMHFDSPYNTGAGADTNDADFDGIANLLEFATASDPTALSPPIGQLVKNGNSLEFTYTRRKAALGEVTFRREFSETLTGEWGIVGTTVETILSDDGVMQLVKVNTPAGSSGKRFVRLRVTRPPG